MKYCVSGRQPLSVLERADEVRLQYKDHDILIDYSEKLPDKTFILDIPESAAVDLPLLHAYAEKVNLILCVETLQSLRVFHKEEGFQSYLRQVITDWTDLDAVVALDPSSIAIGGELAFSLPQVKSITGDIPLRAVANNTKQGNIPHPFHKENYRYFWIRPEDVIYYDKYIHSIDFICNELSKEETLLHIYKENGEYNGNLNLMFTDLNQNIDNRIFPEEFAITRMTCGQRCFKGEPCSYCFSVFAFGKAMREAHYNNKKDSK